MQKLVIILFLCISNLCQGQKVFDFTPTCQQAYNEITSLKINSGQRLLQQARQENPNNLIPEFLDSYIDFFVLFFNEDPELYKQRQDNFDHHLEILSQGNKSSPYYKYCQSVVYLHKSIVAVKFGERFSAAWDFRRAFNLVKANQKSFPAFSPNKLIAGPLQVAVGTIPPGYKWLASILGLSGSIKGGMQSMRSFINANDTYSNIFFNEAAFYYCYLSYYFENDPDEVFRFITARKLDLVNNHVFAYMATNLGKNNKKTDYARNIALKRNLSNEYLQTPVWDLELGYIYLHHLDLDKSIEHLNRFTTGFKGNTYLKEAYQKLSWAYYLKGDGKAAELARQRAVTKGNTKTDADKRAHNESKTGKWPQQLLLRSRLLNDGGYNTEALALLVGKSQADFSNDADRLEFVYRVGRIYDDLEKEEDALKFYNITISQGKDRPEYYAARAALQAGMIMEKRGDKAKAIAYYQQCLDMDDHEFKDSIDQRAKTGIMRCKGE